MHLAQPNLSWRVFSKRRGIENEGEDQINVHYVKLQHMQYFLQLLGCFLLGSQTGIKIK